MTVKIELNIWKHTSGLGPMIVVGGNEALLSARDMSWTS